MSNFNCEICGAACMDGGPGIGFSSGCQHYKADTHGVEICIDTPRGCEHYPPDVAENMDFRHAPRRKHGT